jgi:hypothetical protein
MGTTDDGHREVFGIDLPAFATVRRAGFYAAVLGALAVYAVLAGEMLAFVVSGWFVEPGPHHFHDLVTFGLIWMGILGLVVQLYRPERRVNAVLASVFVMVPLGVIAASTGSPIAMMPILFGTLGLLVVALHPAGRSLLRLERGVPGTRAVGALLAAGTLPLLLYAGGQLVEQYTVADDHALLVHYGGVATAVWFVLAMGTLAVFRTRDRRFAAWSAGLFAAYVGLASTVYPGQPSSPGPLWGGLAVAWGLALVVAFELTREREPESSGEREPESSG